MKTTFKPSNFVYKENVRKNLVFGIFQAEDEALVFILILLVCGVTHIEHLLLHVHSQLFNFILRNVQIITLIKPKQKDKR